jgi:hypothetical protein
MMESAMNVIAAVVVGTAAQAAPATGAAQTGEVKMTLSEVPAPVREGIKKELGGDASGETRVKRRLGKDGAPEYHVDRQASDTKIHYDFSEAGALVRRRDELSGAAVPKVIADVVSRELGVLPVREIARLAQGSTVSYEVEAGTDDHEVDLLMTPEGGLLRRNEKWRTPKMPPAGAAKPVPAASTRAKTAPTSTPKKP